MILSIVVHGDLVFRFYGSSLQVADLSFAVPATAASFVIETVLARIS